MASPSVNRLARDLRTLERGVQQANTAPRLRFSSIDGGTLELRDIAGNTVGYVGEQVDGTTGVNIVKSTPPSQPTMPLVEPIQGGLTVYWDGTWEDGSVTKLDFARVTFHAVLEPEDFDPTNAAQIVGGILTATGGEVNVSLPPVEYLIYAVAWNASGNYSVESDPAFGTPLSLLDAEEWQEHESALDNLNNVALPALADELAASEQRITEATDSIAANVVSLEDELAAADLRLSEGLAALASDTGTSIGSVSDLVDLINRSTSSRHGIY